MAAPIRQVSPSAQDRTSNTASDEEAQALRAEGFDADAPAVVAAIDMVRWEVSLLPRK
jgi:hypothetical protein